MNKPDNPATPADPADPADLTTRIRRQFTADLRRCRDLAADEAAAWLDDIDNAKADGYLGYIRYCHTAATARRRLWDTLIAVAQGCDGDFVHAFTTAVTQAPGTSPADARNAAEQGDDR